MRSLRELEATKTMEKSKGEGFLSTISSGPMADSLGIVVQGRGASVTDGDVKPGEDALFMPLDHPGKLLHGFETAVRGLLEPLVEKARPPYVGPCLKSSLSR